MTSPAKQSPLLGGRPAGGPAPGGLKGTGLAPLPPRERRIGRWLLWLVVLPLLLLGLTYVVGRSVKPIGERLATLPAVGGLFDKPVWPILWNKPPASGYQPNPQTPAGSEAPGTGKADYSGLEAELAARIAAVELREQNATQRETQLKAAEEQMAADQTKLTQSLAEADGLKVRLEGQLRTELDRVAVIRSMKSTAQAQLMNAMTDAEIIAVLKHMTGEEAGKILGTMDSYRAARILHALTQIGSAAAGR